MVLSPCAATALMKLPAASALPPQALLDGTGAGERLSLLSRDVSHHAARRSQSATQHAPPDGEPIVPALRLVCPAASHQLLWQWRAGTWQCPACGG